jgi:uncharacterized coiled-coil DUF342 family protein
MSKGVDSIRLRGKRVEELPLGTGNEAKAQLPLAIEDERLNAIKAVNAEFPAHRIDYLVSRIKECEENKDRMHKTIDQLNTMSSEYNGQIKMCQHRDDEIYKLEKGHGSNGITTEVRDQGIKELKKQFPPYNVEAMEQQIVQNGEGIGRCKEVIVAEDASIKEFTEVVTLCKERDKQLHRLGAVAEGS